MAQDPEHAGEVCAFQTIPALEARGESRRGSAESPLACLQGFQTPLSMGRTPVPLQLERVPAATNSPSRGPPGPAQSASTACHREARAWSIPVLPGHDLASVAVPPRPYPWNSEV